MLLSRPGSRDAARFRVGPLRSTRAPESRVVQVDRKPRRWVTRGSIGCAPRSRLQSNSGFGYSAEREGLIVESAL